MRRLVPLLILLVGSCGGSRGSTYAPANGDVVFQTSRSAQSLAIQKATGSAYSHMGIVYVENGEPYVYEAVEPVKSTPLAEWVARGEGGRFVAKRLRDADRLLTPDALRRMREVGDALRGRHYDLYFEWSDERIYCSELVWKIYHRALGVEIGRLQRMRDFDLSDPVVQAKIRERWSGPPPEDEQVISPAAMFASEWLVTVFEG